MDILNEHKFSNSISHGRNCEDKVAGETSEDEQGVYDSEVTEAWPPASDPISNCNLAETMYKSSGGPFSAITPSMWPQDLLQKLEDEHSEDDGENAEYHYDEFGFKIELDALSGNSKRHQSPLVLTSFTEDPGLRGKWVSYLEFSHSRTVDAELTWDKIDPHLPHSEKLTGMIRDGVPHSLRPQIWLRTSGALDKRTSSKTSYKDIVKASSSDQLMTSKQIEKDLLRTLPTNVCFSHISSTGIPRLRRILRGLAWLFPDIGYCQGTGVIVSHLLLFLEEEETFWLMCSIIEDLLPPSYYSTTLLGVQADQRVLRDLLPTYVPRVHEVLSEHDIELSLICLHWFLTIFASVLHVRVLIRVWDLFFYEGSSVLFAMSLAMLKLKEEELAHLDNSAQIFNSLADAPVDVEDPDMLVKLAYEIAGDLDAGALQSLRKRHLAHLMADEGVLLNPDIERNLPKQHLNKRQLRRSRSVIGLLLWGEGSGDQENDRRAKNVRQTEMLVDLRNAILQIVRHFQAMDPRHTKVNIQPDYTLESHARDLESYVQVARNRRRRAKALLDFERHDDDELGFRKNDIITVLSMRDEHCWVGELNGLRGWFPAKFVELLDERSKNYSPAGDDTVNETITDLVRGILCPTLRSILEHGLRRPSLLDSTCHPWHFIEEAATREVEKDFNSVYSRLVLCKTFRLDEDGKVLTPEEVLYKAVQSINLTHDSAHAQMDVKFRSLICYGLNEQVLHLWLETLCSCVEIVNKWYYPWSFMRSPGWVQIKCELRVLGQFAFNLSRDWELTGGSTGNNGLGGGGAQHKSRFIVPIPGLTSSSSANFTEGVREMLVKHHLFSWEL